MRGSHPFYGRQQNRGLPLGVTLPIVYWGIIWGMGSVTLNIGIRRNRSMERRHYYWLGAAVVAAVLFILFVAGSLDQASERVFGERPTAVQEK